MNGLAPLAQAQAKYLAATPPEEETPSMRLAAKVAFAAIGAIAISAAALATLGTIAAIITFVASVIASAVVISQGANAVQNAAAGALGGQNPPADTFDSLAEILGDDFMRAEQDAKDDLSKWLEDNKYIAGILRQMGLSDNPEGKIRAFLERMVRRPRSYLGMDTFALASVNGSIEVYRDLKLYLHSTGITLDEFNYIYNRSSNTLEIKKALVKMTAVCFVEEANKLTSENDFHEFYCALKDDLRKEVLESVCLKHMNKQSKGWLITYLLFNELVTPKIRFIVEEMRDKNRAIELFDKFDDAARSLVPHVRNPIGKLLAVCPKAVRVAIKAQATPPQLHKYQALLDADTPDVED